MELIQRLAIWFPIFFGSLFLAFTYITFGGPLRSISDNYNKLKKYKPESKFKYKNLFSAFIFSISIPLLPFCFGEVVGDKGVEIGGIITDLWLLGAVFLLSLVGVFTMISNPKILIPHMIGAFGGIICATGSILFVHSAWWILIPLGLLNGVSLFTKHKIYWSEIAFLYSILLYILLYLPN